MLCVHLPVANSSNVSRWGKLQGLEGLNALPHSRLLCKIFQHRPLSSSPLLLNPLILWDLTFKINMSVNATNVGLTRIKDSDKESEPRTKTRIKDQNRNQEAIRSSHILKWNPIWYGCIFLLITFCLQWKNDNIPCPRSITPWALSALFCLKPFVPIANATWAPIV